MPVVAKTLKPCPEPKSTISGWTLVNINRYIDDLGTPIALTLAIAIRYKTQNTVAGFMP
jgi:hypothetical protein